MQWATVVAVIAEIDYKPGCETIYTHKIYTMTETKVYKLHEGKQVEFLTTMLKIEGINYKVFEYEEYTAIEVTGTPLEIIRASAIYQHVITFKI